MRTDGRKLSAIERYARAMAREDTISAKREVSRRLHAMRMNPDLWDNDAVINAPMPRTYPGTNWED